MSSFDRRQLLSGAGLAVSSALLPHFSSPAHAKAPFVGAQATGVYRYKVGDIEVTALNDGLFALPLKDGFVKNAKFADVQAGMTEAFLSPDVLPIPFTILLVNTGSKLILIDTGTGGLFVPTAGTATASLAAAGVRPEDIDTIIISHFHPDHINGIRPKEGLASYPNAEIMVPAAEWDFWMDDAKAAQAPDGPLKNFFANSRRVFTPIAKDVKRFAWDKEIVSGITAIAAPGHTPGHTAFAVTSGNAKLLVLSDTTNHPALFVRNPDWSPVLDLDADTARTSRRRLLDMAASERMHVAGYHFPFPANGYIARDGNRFQLVPVAWNPVL